MCGRFALELNSPELVKRAKKLGFEVKDVDKSQAVKPRLNIAPHSYCWVLVPKGLDQSEHQNDQLRVMKWSLQPTYTSEPVKYPTFNTRVESLDPLKPTWRCAKQYRCVVFMQGYYEWHRDTKKPYYIYQNAKESKGNAQLSASNGIMCCLAIWDGTEDRQPGGSTGGRSSGSDYPSGGGDSESRHNSDRRAPTFSIVTMPAPTKELESLHTRTPIIVTPEAAMKWISADWEDALEMVNSLSPTQLVPLTFHQVSIAVNSVKAESPNLNKKIVENKITDFFKRKPASDSDSEVSPKKMKTN